MRLDPLAAIVKVLPPHLIVTTKPSPPNTAADAVVVTRAIWWNDSFSRLWHVDPLPWRNVATILLDPQYQRIGRFLKTASEISESARPSGLYMTSNRSVTRISWDCWVSWLRVVLAPGVSVRLSRSDCAKSFPAESVVSALSAPVRPAGPAVLAGGEIFLQDGVMFSARSTNNQGQARLFVPETRSDAPTFIHRSCSWL